MHPAADSAELDRQGVILTPGSCSLGDILKQDYRQRKSLNVLKPTTMSQESLGPCSLCCGLIAHITNTIDRPAEESVETTTRQPQWHETPQQILESGKSCLLCESIWQATLLPLLENTERELDNISKVLLRFGSYNKVNSVYWANIRTTLEVKEYKEIIAHVDCIGISIQPEGSGTLCVS